MSQDEVVTYPGARRPDRSRFVGPEGARLAVYEWGDPDGKPVFMAHGGFDFAGTFDVFAPLIADQGYRVVTWDHRGHGDSDHAALYSWQADQRDALLVLDTVTREPVPMIGHSKGGGVLMQVCEARPHRVSRFINIDGMPSKWNTPDVANHERTRLRDSELSAWLDHRRRAADITRKPGTIDDLARRRGRMNSRLSHEWLRYLVPIGARKDDDGWRWKIDPVMRFGGFGPWRPDWYLKRLPGFPVPLLGIMGMQPEEMGWGTKPDEVEPYLPPDARLVAFEDAGHFVHIEHPQRVADLCLEFLA